MCHRLMYDFLTMPFDIFPSPDDFFYVFLSSFASYILGTSLLLRRVLFSMGHESTLSSDIFDDKD